MPYDAELFAKSLAAYEKVVGLNYMAHREVYGILRDILVAEAADQFVFLDIACGTASASAEAERHQRGRYIGIDISSRRSRWLRRNSATLRCPVDLRCQDFVEAFSTWNEPVDVVWIGQSLHHLPHPAKSRTSWRGFRMCCPRRVLPGLGANLSRG